MIDKKLLRFILLFYLLASLYGVFIALFQKYLEFSYVKTSWSILLASLLFNYGTKLIYILGAIILTKSFLLNKLSIFLSVLVHTLLSIGLTFFSSILLLTFEKYFMGYPDTNILESLLFRVGYSSNFNFFVYFTIISIVYAYSYFVKQENQKVLEISLKKQILDAKMKMLQTQLQPHFLFNTLNDISSLIDINKEKAQNAIADLSNLLRKTLRIKDKKWITLEEELALLKTYLKIEKLRFQDKVDFIFQVDENLLHSKTPPLILQPIVENALKHGFSLHFDQIQVTITILRQKNKLIYKVINNGSPIITYELVYGNGLSNVLERLQTLYTHDYKFKIKNVEINSKTNVQAEIKIPYLKA